MSPCSFLPTPPVTAYYSSLFVNCRPGADVMWHLAALYFVTMALVPFVFVAEHGFLGFSCYDCEEAKAVAGCSSLLPLVYVDELINKDLCPLSFDVSVIWSSPTWQMITQRKLIALHKACLLAGSPMALPKNEYMPWGKLLSHGESKM